MLLERIIVDKHTANRGTVRHLYMIDAPCHRAVHSALKKKDYKWLDGAFVDITFL